ncbi:MAG: hypothetical protein KC466_16500, partial [Myxococcales bacterium]|nr:hypothetical protein [Myxococcales bacterium]
PVGLEEAARSDRSVSEGGRSCSVAALLRLVEDERAAESDDSTLLVPYAEIARLTQAELAGLGLPPAYPFTVDVSGTGLITDPGFKLRYRLWNREGRPILADTRRIGCLLDLGPNRYVLQEPLYSLIAGIDAFGADPPATAAGRIQRWAELSGLAPADAEVDRQLRNLRFALATRFALQPFINERGEPDFDPVLGVDGARRADDPVEGETPFHEALPQAYQREFGKRFRALRHVKRQHALGGGCYVLATETLERVLAVVKERQSQPPAERAAFLRAPHQSLREALGEDADETLLDEVFSDAHLSERVAAIGVWKPKVLPWFKAASEPWLPPEPMGVRVGEQILQVPADDRADLRHEVERAIAEGTPSVSYAGHVLPATSETLDALKSLQEGIQPEKAPSRDETPAEAPAFEGPLVLLVRGNLEDREYECRVRGRRRWIEAIRPTQLFSTLHPHQEEAYRWLLSSWNAGVSGVLLADDMGLGKTLEALAFLARVKDLMLDGDLDHRPFMVVAPTGLLRNWMDEHDRHLKRPGLGRVVCAFGAELRKLRSQPSRKSSELDHGLPFLDLRALEEADWVVASYETVRDYQHSFGRIHWSVVVFDEAQKIKNPAAAMTDAAKALKADFFIAATGTPVENRLADLWCIVDAVRPGELGALKEFRDEYEDPAALDDGKRDTLRRRLMESSRRSPGTTNPPLLLRRLKTDHVSGLPRRHEERHEVPMPEIQADAYADAVARARSRKGEPGAMLEALQALRSVSLHPYQRGSDDRDDAAYIAASARLRALFEVLDRVRARREKALVFVEFREMQGELVGMLLRRYAMAHPPLIINGAVSGPKRKQRVD